MRACCLTTHTEEGEGVVVCIKGARRNECHRKGFGEGGGNESMSHKE